MDEKCKSYIDSLEIASVPWNRMYTAYGTAANYPELLEILKQETDPDQWADTFETITDFETQGTLFLPAPFVLVFLMRIFAERLSEDSESSLQIAEKLAKQFLYYAEICADAEKREHTAQLPQLSDLLHEQYLLEPDADDLEELFENPDFVPDDLFYSLYFYAKAVLSQAPALLADSCKFAEIHSKFQLFF